MPANHCNDAEQGPDGCHLQHKCMYYCTTKVYYLHMLDKTNNYDLAKKRAMMVRFLLETNDENFIKNAMIAARLCPDSAELLILGAIPARKYDLCKQLISLTPVYMDMIKRAVRYKNVELVRLFLQHYKNPDMNELLPELYELGDLDLLAEYDLNNANIQWVHRAAASGNFAMVKLVMTLTSPKDRAEAYLSLCYSLYYAFKSGNHDIIDIYVELFTDPIFEPGHQSENLRLNFLAAAARSGDLSVVKKAWRLLNDKLSVMLPRENEWYIVLHRAILGGNHIICRLVYKWATEAFPCEQQTIQVYLITTAAKKNRVDVLENIGDLVPNWAALIGFAFNDGGYKSIKYLVDKGLPISDKMISRLNGFDRDLAMHMRKS